jgi:integrase
MTRAGRPPSCWRSCTGSWSAPARHTTCRRNPVADVDRIRVSYDAARFDFYSPEEVYALARAAVSEQDAALFLTAAFAGLRRGELVALRWRDVDFEKRSIRVEGSFSHGAVTTTKGGRAPLVAEAAQVLARLGQRGYATDRDDPVFPGDVAGHLDASALRRRFIVARDTAGLRPLRSFCGIRSARWRSTARASCRSRRGWAKTTMRYLHHIPRERGRAPRRCISPGARPGRDFARANFGTAA